MVDATLACSLLAGVLKPKVFLWALIPAQHDLVELRLRMDGQVGASREVLPQQEIRVFVGAALPGCPSPKLCKAINRVP